jgi:WhiB family redox-sensing transcriptional regulator
VLSAALELPPHLPLAACRAEGVDPAWWFPERGQPLEPAKAVCRRCAEREACLAWALVQGSKLSGVWGGTSELERRKLRRRDGPAVVAAFEDMEPDAVALAEVEEPAADMSESFHGQKSDIRCCGMCGGPLASNQPKWCSRSCQKKAAWRRNGRSAAPVLPQERPEAVVLETRSQVSGISTLVPAGATVTRIEFAVAGDSWTLTRSNGGPP